MTRDETIKFLTGLFEKKLIQLRVTPPLTFMTLTGMAESLAVAAVNELGGTLKLDPQYAGADATLRRAPSNSMM